MRRAAALLLLSVALAGCGDDGPLSVKEASLRSAEEPVDVKGMLIVEFGRPMLCSGPAGPEEGTRCGSPALWINGRLPAGYSDGDSVTFRGVVEDGFIQLSG